MEPWGKIHAAGEIRCKMESGKWKYLGWSPHMYLYFSSLEGSFLTGKSHHSIWEGYAVCFLQHNLRLKGFSHCYNLSPVEHGSQLECAKTKHLENPARMLQGQQNKNEFCAVQMPHSLCAGSKCLTKQNNPKQTNNPPHSRNLECFVLHVHANWEGFPLAPSLSSRHSAGAWEKGP